MIEEKLINILKSEVESKVVKKILTGKDCVVLSKQIYNETRNKISVTTLKRFFGIVNSDFNFSNYTLESLVQFVGYKSISDLRTVYSKSNIDNSVEDSWELLKKKVRNITLKSLDSMKTRTGYQTEKFIFRDFVRDKFELFAESDKNVTFFSAPFGFGKTTLLIQLAEYYFLNGKTVRNDDILLLIDGKIFFNLYAQDPNDEFLEQLLHFNLLSSWTYHFFKNSAERKGRIWLFIDNVDDVYFDTESYHNLLENLMRMIMAYNYDWYKIVITCRPENLDVFNLLAENYPLLKNLWFDMQTGNERNLYHSANVPLLSKQEINQILKINDLPYDYNYFNNISPELVELINQPGLLSLFIEELKTNTNASVVVLLLNFLKKSIYTPPYENEKIKIINRFMELSNRGKETNSVKKDELLIKSDMANAYRELISKGIIYEFVKPSDLLIEDKWVRFGNNIILNFLLTERWCHGREMTIELYNSIRKYYIENKQLQNDMTKMYFHFLAYQNKHELLKKLRLISALRQSE